MWEEDYESIEDFYEVANQKREQLLETLKATPGIKDAFLDQSITCPFSPIVGQAQTLGPLIDKERIESYLEHLGATLTD